MVSKYEIEKQLNAIGFVNNSWNYKEIRELPSIILPDEKIYECVHGWYENGVALLIGTNFRIILIDKKPLHFLKVEDLRFDMINQIDYAHGIFDASIIIATGNKTLRFRSFSQKRLRRLISMVQHHMAQSKKYAMQNFVYNTQQLDNIEVPYNSGKELYSNPEVTPKALYEDAMKSIFGGSYKPRASKTKSDEENSIDLHIQSCR